MYFAAKSKYMILGSRFIVGENTICLFTTFDAIYVFC